MYTHTHIPTHVYRFTHVTEECMCVCPHVCASMCSCVHPSLSQLQSLFQAVANGAEEEHSC